MTPTLTLNGGLRWDLQTAVHARPTTRMSAVDAGVGLRHVRASATAAPSTSATSSARAPTPAWCREFVQLTKRHQGLRDRLEQRRAEHQRRVAAERAGRLPAHAPRRSRSGDAPRRLLGVVRASGHGRRSPASTAAIRAARSALTRNVGNGNLVPPGESWPVLLSQTDRLYPRVVPEHADLSRSPSAPNRADSLNAFAPDIKIGSARDLDGRASSARSRSDMAVDVRYVGTRGVNQWSTLNYNTRDIEATASSTSSSSRWQNLQANNAVRRHAARAASPTSAPAPARARCRSTWPISTASRDAEQSGAPTPARTWTNTGITQDMAFRNPIARQLGGGPRRRPDAPHERDRGGPAGELLRRQPGGQRQQRHRQRRVQRLPRAADRPAAPALAGPVGQRQLPVRASKAARRSSASATAGHDARRANVRHAIKTQWDWTIPVGRGQRFGTDMHPVLDGILGGWSFNGVGRIQARDGQLRQRPPGRHDAKTTCRRCTSTTSGSTRPTGCETVYMLPDDVILNTRRAFSVSPTHGDRLQPALGAPEGRYFAPANSESCIQLKAGDCAPRDAADPRAVVHALRCRRHQEVPAQGPHRTSKSRFDVLNLFDNINFNNVGQPRLRARRSSRPPASTTTRATPTIRAAASAS